MDEGELDPEVILSEIIRDEKPPVMDAERERIIKIMQAPIKATSTELYYLAQDRQKIRKLLNGGIL